MEEKGQEGAVMIGYEVQKLDLILEIVSELFQTRLYPIPLNPNMAKSFLIIKWG